MYLIFFAFHKPFATMADMILLGISAFFSLTSLTMYSASIGASSYHFYVLKNTHWVHVLNPDFRAYVGFKAVAVRSNGFEQVQHLNNCGSHDAICYKCGGEGGKATLSFLAIALIFSFFSLALTGARFANAGDKMTKFLQLVVKVIAVGFGVAAFCSYSPCHQQLIHEIGKHDVHYGTGFGLCICATFLLVLSFILSSFAFGSSAPARVPTKDQA